MDNIYSFINKFMYFIFRTDETDPSSLLYCSGVSMPQFLPITRGRHGLASNPAMRGLQIVDLNLRNELHARGAQTANVRGNPCGKYVPQTGDWYRQLLRIGNADADEQVVKELVGRCPLNLLSSIFQACMITDIALPAVSPAAGELEGFLTDVCEKYSKQAGWPTSASARGFRK